MNRLLKIGLYIIILSKVIFAIEPIVTLEADKESIYVGENVNITLSVIANKDAKIEFTHQADIVGEKIIKRKALSSIDTVENGNKTEDIIEKKIIYTIKPKKNLHIPSFIVKVNNKKYKSEPIDIAIIKESQESSVKKEPIKKSIIFKISSNRKRVYKGEPFIVTVTLKEPIEYAAPNSIKYSEPKFKDCKVVKLRTLKPNNNDTNYVTMQEYFLVTPKKAGKLLVPALSAEINMQMTPQVETMFGFFGTQTQIKRVKSNSLTINVDPIPKNAQLVGDYKISQSVNKTKTSADKQIVYSFEIKGFGDISSLNEYELKIDGVTIYPKDAIVEHSIKDGKVLSSYKKEYVLISDKDFTIPSINITAFSPTKKRVYKLRLKPIHIKVTSKMTLSNILKKSEKGKNRITNNNIIKTEDSINKSKKNIVENENVKIILDTKYYNNKIKELENSSTDMLLYILGLISGILATLFMPKLISLIKTKDEKSQLYGSYHEALNILYPHTTESPEIEEMVKKLYEVTNGNKEIVIDNKKLDKMIYKINKKRKK